MSVRFRGQRQGRKFTKVLDEYLAVSDLLGALVNPANATDWSGEYENLLPRKQALSDELNEFFESIGA